MDEVVMKAWKMGADSAAITRWLDRVDPAFGMTPRQLIGEGRESEVLDALSQMDEGVFA